jgi:hypothetical protein
MAALLRTLTPHVGRIYSAIALDEGDDAMQETMIRVLSPPPLPPRTRRPARVDATHRRA